jgi:hypothetical protein
MSSKTEIANMALSHIGIGKDVANLDTEKSQEATACRRFYPVSLRTTLRDVPWPFATSRRTLALITEDPNDDWDFSYRYPSDCLFIRRILSGIRNDTQQSRAQFKIEQAGGGKVLFTDVEDAIAEYTIVTEDTSLFPPDFELALSLRLAVYIAPRLTAGDPFKLQSQVMQLYRIEIAKANASAINEGQPDENPDAELIRSRE